MREVSTEEITKNIKEMCIEANYTLSDDVKNKTTQLSIFVPLAILL